MARYLLTPAAQRDICEITAYIKKNSSRGALAVAREIKRICKLVGSMPYIGHLAEDIGAGELYHLPAGKYANYIIFYVLKDETPVIVRVIHAKRDIPALLSRWYATEEFYLSR